MNFSDASEESDNQEPHGSYKLEATQGGNAPENNSHVNVGPLCLLCFLILLITRRDPLQASRAQNHGRESKVGNHPDEHDAGTHTSVVVHLFFLQQRRRRLRFYFLVLYAEDRNLSLVLRIQITLVGKVRFALAIFGVDGWQLLHLVITLRTPRHVMGVAKGVDVENVGKGWSQEHVLKEGSNHVPRVEHEKGCNEPDTVSRHDGNDERVENLILKQLTNVESVSVVEIRDDGLDSDEDGCKHQVAKRNALE